MSHPPTAPPAASTPPLGQHGEGDALLLASADHARHVSRDSIESGCYALSPSTDLPVRAAKRSRTDDGTPTSSAPAELHARLFNDAIHGHIELDPLCVAVVDTPQFQRLRGLKQLGMGSLVFPSANHCRFEHSIGTCHLAGQMVERLQTLQPELGITDVDVLCVKIAGLCHDLGHGPFSHTFERHVNATRGVASGEWAHEMASTAMFRHLVDANGLMDVFAARGLDMQDIGFIQELIAGASPADWDAQDTMPRGRPREKSFLFDIVANKRNGVDVDKWDYFCRDSTNLNIKAPFDYRRYLLSVRVFEDSDGLRHICPRDKEVESVYDMWNARTRLHRTAYQHKTVKVLDLMLLDVLRLAEPYIHIPGTNGKLCTMSEAVDDMVAYTKLTDAVLYLVEVSTNPELLPARTVLSNIHLRQLYKFVGKAHPGTGGDAARIARSQLHRVSQEMAALTCPMSSAAPSDDEQTDAPTAAAGVGPSVDGGRRPIIGASDIVLDLIEISHGPGKQEPIHNLRFWSKDDTTRTFKISPKEVSHMLPSTDKEVRLCVYTKRRNHVDQAILRDAVRRWCLQNDFEFRASPLEPSTPMRHAVGVSLRDTLATSTKPIPFDPSA
eukprot:m.22467 g.22467  ORF g.22467 m.22467 type:complete len:611 (+) comp3989_c0_seq1:145-1977(+)